MRAIVIGSAAGGAFPQWNCGCTGCVAVREGRDGFLPRTQDSLAVAATSRAGNVERFVLVNASPDVLAQIKATPSLWPRSSRHSPIGAIVLTNGDLDHVLGLFSMRESQPLAVYATAPVWRGLEASVLVRTLRRFEGQLVFRALALEVPVDIADASGAPLGLSIRAFATPGKLPVHLMGHTEPSPEDNIGLALSERTSERARDPAVPTLAYAAACASLEGVHLEGHAAVLFDGTFFREDELVRQGLSKSVAKDMAHLPIDQSLAALSKLGTRVVYTHINNTNPILDPKSAERREVEAAGIDIAYDGMEIHL